jgi:uncharacterized membrane protein YagU involved in acid resistance
MRSRCDDNLERDYALWKGAIAGLVGGLAGAWLMNEFQAVWFRASEMPSHGRTNQEPQQPQRSDDSEPDDATVRAAEVISESVLGRTLTTEQKKLAGPIVHYTFGAITGVVYGAAAEAAPAVTSGYGVTFGTAVWLAADELAVPAFGLSKPVTAYPLSVHAYALASHLVYGVATDVVRRAVRATL